MPEQAKIPEYLGKCDIVHVHDDGDLTIKCGGKKFVVTMEGETFKEVEKEPTKPETAKIVQGLVGCKCITEELAVILEELIARAKANAKNYIDAPYGKQIESWVEKINQLEAAEDALKGLDLCQR